MHIIGCLLVFVIEHNEVRVKLIDKMGVVRISRLDQNHWQLDKLWLKDCTGKDSKRGTF
jgi:hypothetical protein